MPLRHRRANVLALFTMALAIAGCGSSPASPIAAASAPAVPSAAASAPAAPSAAASAAAANDLAAIACSTDDPEDVGALTGAWQGDDGGVYYIRQVGDCVWWFGTELADIEPGKTGQGGFANVAAGRVDGTEIDLEWADLTIGNIVGGGGLTISIDQGGDRLEVTEQRGDWGFGGRTFSRIDPSPSASVAP